MAHRSQSGLSAAAVIDIWEQGAGRHPLDRALLLLRYTCPDEPFETLCEWTMGERDRRLLVSRRNTFGDRIDGYADCPACGNGLEFELSCEGVSGSASTTGATWHRVEQAGRSWDMRGPNSLDLAAAAAAPDLDRARRVILSRCMRSGTDMVDEAEWTDELQAALAARLSELDPLAEILIDVRCAACGHAWQSVFDIADFFWNEIHVRSKRLLQEIDLLARTYGWTEGEILGMTDQRRSLYVGMALS
jgi:hypothetical protein